MAQDAFDKDAQLEAARSDPQDSYLTTQQGVRVGHTDDSLSAGARGPTLLEDFHAREKLTHFDHERIPERVVHARGAGAYGHFRPYDNWLAEYTTAEFLTDPEHDVPTFTRFSTVAGSRGSADTVRDVRGFATKFYTRQGNYDLVGNNMPVFFIQDGIKFPDFVHAVKPEPASEIPQAQSAHDTFWDFVALQPETMHMVMWLMSDRALPRSYRMMQGFGVHTFRLVNAEGRGTFVKFHWTPMLGTHSLVWDECQKLAGQDPDFNRRDLWEAIESGNYPEYELGVQLIAEDDEFSFDFDLLDPTKIVPEEQVPVRPVGKLTLDRNPDNFFAETEQVAFHTANLVPGIDFTNDPLLQARNFSYLDTQLIRLGGPNFAQLPVNRPLAEVHTNQRDGYHQSTIHKGQASYTKNSVAGGCPVIAGTDNGAYAHYAEKVEGAKIRQRSESFQDHYSQATLFWNSMSEVEKAHIVDALCFELGKVVDHGIRENVIGQLNHVDHRLAASVAEHFGIEPPDEVATSNNDASSAALSQLNTRQDTAQTRKVAILVADGVDAVGLRTLMDGLSSQGVIAEVLAAREGTVRSADGADVSVDHAMYAMSSVLYDAIAVPGGADSAAALSQHGVATHYLAEAYKHGKPIAAFGSGADVLERAGITGVQRASDTEVQVDQGVVTSTATASDLPERFPEAFVAEIARHRCWERDTNTIAA